MFTVDSKENFSFLNFLNATWRRRCTTHWAFHEKPVVVYNLVVTSTTKLYWRWFSRKLHSEISLENALVVNGKSGLTEHNHLWVQLVTISFIKHDCTVKFEIKLYNKDSNPNPVATDMQSFANDLFGVNLSSTSQVCYCTNSVWITIAFKTRQDLEKFTKIVNNVATFC